MSQDTSFKLTPSDILDIRTVSDDQSSPDSRVHILLFSHLSKYIGILLEDNSGWSYVDSTDIDAVATAIKNHDENFFDVFSCCSTIVDGIKIRNDYSRGWIIEEEDRA